MNCNTPSAGLLTMKELPKVNCSQFSILQCSRPKSHQHHTRLNQHLDKYNQMAESPTNHYNNKQLNLKHLKFVEAVKKLLMSVNINFGFPGTQHDIMNLQNVAPHETERYKKVFSEVRILNHEMCSCYDDYIKKIKKKLFI